mmetsp:Transcript_26119/g.36821  ORF Transcript_26119/g.36821 Transcript_26119/m.36821 type:complete len:428 (-) Transcript_26119:162-1445(-)
MKLIHSGKVLKDDQTIEGCNIKENDFLVVMVTKAKKAAAAPKPAATPAPAPAAAATPATPAPAAATPAPAAAAAASTEATPAPSSSTSDQPANPPPAPSRPDEFPAEVVSNLTTMGFPEAEVKACLRASNGNPDIAVEFLTNGIPEAVQLQQQQQQQLGQPSPAAGGGSSSGGEPLQALREHPQFDALRRLVQSNPQMLQAVLTQIGQQQPELLQEINANQQQFLAMMNEPVSDAPAAPAAPSSSAPAPAGGSSSSGAGAGAGGNPMAGMMEGMANPAQMAQMLQNMSPNELNEMATMMGLTPEQLQATVRMIGQIPPDQLQEYMAQAMAGGGPGGMMGGGPGGGGFGGPQVLRLNEEEMAAVDRLTEMGFDRAEAAQAFLACDKNEALAANLLMDSAGQDGGAFGFGDDNGGDANGGGDDGDDMYD